MGTFEAPPRNKSWFGLVRELALEAQGYVRGLGGMVALECKEGARTLGRLGALAAAGALVLLCSLGLLTLALVGLVAYWMDSWRWALLLVGAGYGLAGAGMVAAAVKGVRRGPLRLEQTRRRLRADARELKKKLAA